MLVYMRVHALSLSLSNSPTLFCCVAAVESLIHGTAVWWRHVYSSKKYTCQKTATDLLVDSG